MSQQTVPAGWYVDPQAPAGTVPGLRWWDGRRWTEHVSWPAAPMWTAGTDGTPSTPDGDPLAGWWSRVGASVIDGVILLLVSLTLGFPFVREIVGAYVDLIRDAFDPAQAQASAPDPLRLYETIWVPLVAFAAISIVVNLTYNVGFLAWRAATPGKLVLGLRVRLRERRGPMPLGTILLRWVGQFGPNLLGLVPWVGTVAGFYPWVDGLWPLWDERRQALHDKLAKTNVVKVSRD